MGLVGAVQDGGIQFVRSAELGQVVLPVVVAVLSAYPTLNYGCPGSRENAGAGVSYANSGRLELAVRHDSPY